MKPRYFADAAGALAANVGTRLVGLAIVAMTFRVYPVELMGSFNVALAYFGYAAALIEAGLTAALIELRHRQRFGELADILFYRLVTGFVLVVAGAVAIGIDGVSALGWQLLPLLAALACGASAADWTLLARLRFRTLYALGLLGQLGALAIAACSLAFPIVLLLALMQLTVTFTLNSVPLAMMAARERHYYRLALARRLGAPLAVLMRVVKSNVGYSLVVVVVGTLLGVDMALAGFTLAGETLGHFAALNRLGLLTASFQAVLSNVAYGYLVKGRQQAGFVLTFLPGLALGAMTAAVLLAFPSLVLQILFGHQYADISPLVRLYAAVPLLITLYYALNTFLQRNARQLMALRLRGLSAFLVTMVLIIGAGYWLGRRYGTEGLIAFSYLKWIAALVAARLWLLPKRLFEA